VTSKQVTAPVCPVSLPSVEYLEAIINKTNEFNLEHMEELILGKLFYFILFYFMLIKIITSWILNVN